MAGVDLRIDIRRLRDDTLFKDAGADSLDLFNLILAVEDEYHIRVPSEDLYRVNSLAAMTEYLIERLS
jgi:acyl carrier protein